MPNRVRFGMRRALEGSRTNPTMLTRVTCEATEQQLGYRPVTFVGPHGLEVAYNALALRGADRTTAR